MSEEANLITSERQRIRLTYEKGAAIKFVSHADEFRLWERTLRRAGLPLLYKQGFNPQPHIQFASPLGVGITGVAELVDVIFSPPVALNELEPRIRAVLPPGVALHGLAEMPLADPALQQRLLGADYTILIYAEPGETDAARLQERIAHFLAAQEVWRVRQRKGEEYTYNLRPLVFELIYEGYDPVAEEHRVFLRVQQRPGATGRPDEVVDALGFDEYARTLRRDRLYFDHDPVDAEVFAAYPVVEQAEIAAPGAPPRRKRGRRYTHRRHDAPAPSAPTGSSINDRAGDEFA